MQTQQSQWIIPTPSNSWTKEEFFYPLQGLPAQEVSFKNDAGTDIVKAENARQAFKDTAVATCTREHPKAVKALNCKLLKKPYCECVDEKMARYDEAVEAGLRASRMAAALKSDAEAAASTATNAPISPPSAPANNQSSTTGNIIPSSNTALYVGFGIIALIAVAFVFLGFRKNNIQQEV